MGIARTALLWGLGWTILASAGLAVLWLAGVVPPRATGQDAAFLLARFALWGVLSGLAFAGVARLLERIRRPSEISRMRFALLGAVGTAVFVPGMMQLFNVLSGDGPVPMRFVLDDAAWAFFFGGGAAWVTLEIARRRERLS